MLFQGSRPSLRLGALWWRLGLTGRSRRTAAPPLNYFVSLPAIICTMLGLSPLPPPDICAGLSVLVVRVGFGSNPAQALMLGTLTASVFVALCVCAALSVWPLWLPGQQAAATLKIDKLPLSV